METSKKSSNFIFIGIFFTSCAALTFEISLTRIFSVSLWYHFAFMVVSIALLGYGVSGSFLMLIPRINKEHISKYLFYLSLLFSLSIPFFYAVSNRIPFDPVKISWDINQLYYIFFYYLFYSIPFFFAGLIISMALANISTKSHTIYFFDLIGAASGSIVALFAFSFFSESGAALFASLIGLVGTVFFQLSDKGKVKKILITLLLFISTLLYIQPDFLKVRISPYKGLKVALQFPGAHLIKSKWNSYSRLDVVESPAIRFAPGLSLKYLESLPPQVGFSIDGGNLTAITNYPNNSKKLGFIDFLPASASYFMKKDIKNVLVLEPGGGLDILSALYHGMPDITVMERNRLIYDLIKNDYDSFSGNIYSKKEVTVEIGEWRNLLKGKSDKHKMNRPAASGQGNEEESSLKISSKLQGIKPTVWDLIQISPSNIFAPASTVLQGLNEDYRYTEEAFKELYSHLTSDGLLSITVFLHPPPRAELRLFNILYSALEKMGVQNPTKHFFIFRTWGTITFLIKKNELQSEEIERLQEFCSSLWFDPVYYHGISERELNQFNSFDKPIYHELITNIVNRDSLKDFLGNYLFDVSSVTDNKPYFHHFFKWDRVYDLYKSMGDKWLPIIEGGYLVPIVFVQALLASIVFILLPAFFSRKVTTPLPPPLLRGNRWKCALPKGLGGFLTYFFLIGSGFMMIEIVIIQKFILLLDHPVYAFAIVIFSFLISAGIGSYVSGRYKPINMLGIRKIIWILCGMVLLFYILTALWDKILFFPLIVRLLLAVIFIFPFGFFMGMPFPMGIRKLESFSPLSIPWAWCANGCSSVLSSVLAIILALAWGFHTVLFIALGFYIMAAEVMNRRDSSINS